MELDVNFNFKKNEIYNINKKIKSYVSRQEILLAKKLIESKGEVVRREELLTHCWEGKIVTDSSLNVAVRNLRLALIDCGSSLLITTVPRQGYCIRENSGFSTNETLNDKVSDSVVISPKVRGLGDILDFFNSEESTIHSIFIKCSSQLIFLVIFSYMLYVLIMPYQFENIKGINSTSFGLLLDDKYNQIFEYLNYHKASDVYIMPSADNCVNTQILAIINGEVFDLTNKFRLDDCESI
ncbi:hypothetical protein BCU71_06220 [Vibrio lentus]|uniref:winged helix-turn-helix domain-containing protein n=1 Tax=Vibrio lentus TaxID=136468 RepID=UPI000C852A9E|nr:winged helix-turn-helix domain-containing protein [Vibrio lentus]PMH28163.1 hypothetical protein BCU71_06220 [Vibrio lentus]PMK70145.1 hypothetical protein BCT93_05855 [Vibrio lentus]